MVICPRGWFFESPPHKSEGVGHRVLSVGEPLSIGYHGNVSGRGCGLQSHHTTSLLFINTTLGLFVNDCLVSPHSSHLRRYGWESSHTVMMIKDGVGLIKYHLFMQALVLMVSGPFGYNQKD